MIHGSRTMNLLAPLLFWGALCALAAETQPARVYIPQWSQGQTWSVECDVPDPLVAKIPPWLDQRKPGTARRPRWVFTVEKVANLTEKLRLIRIAVRGAREGARAGADLVFAGRIETGGRLGSLFMYKAEYRYPVGRGINTVRKDYNRMATGPFPVFNDVNDVPCDFPYLDLTFNPTPDAKADGVWREFKATEAVEGDLRNRSVRQTILFAVNKVQFGERFKVPVERGHNQDVYLRLMGGRGNETARLVFNSEYPWPVYGEGPRGKFWLVK